MNHLMNEKSPYLLQHAENLVDWHPWGKEAFEKAEKEDLPIFLSIGYSTCHWCHVMAHESFEDAEVAEFLNKHFVCIKVDREERPDIDSVYMAACQAVTGSGGWPLTAILTPDQKPFFLGTYFPKHQRYGHPGLMELLRNLASMWKQNRSKLLETGQQITEFLSAKDHTSGAAPDRSLLKKAAAFYRNQYDSRWGGFGNAPKFPAPHNLLFLLAYGALENDRDLMAMAEQTLKAMARGGINDHIGGGFSRYSTDEKWLAPHFEKMLYDNALLSIAYLEAFKAAGESFYADTARRTLDYVLNELTGPRGEFFCGQDADSGGGEGRYYLFTPKEIVDVLGDSDGREFCAVYDVTAKGNFEGKSIPNLIGRDIPPWPADDRRLKKLYDYRKKRASLHKDDKVILSWNGWMIIAMAKASQILGDTRYLDAAVKACRFIDENMTDDQGRLYLRWRDGEAANAGQLDDYAVFGLGLLELYRATYEIVYLEKAVFFAGRMLDLFEDKADGGCFLTASDSEVLITRPKETYDGAVPSGNSAAAVLLGQLAQYTCDPVWLEALERQTGFLADVSAEYPAGHSFGLQSFLQILYPSRELICVSADKQLPEELKDYLHKFPTWNLCVILKTHENQTDLERVIPFLENYPVPAEGTMYYLCQGGKCHTPERDFTSVRQKLQ